MPNSDTLKIRTARPMVIRVAGSENVADYPAGSVVEISAREALRLIAEGYADGVQAETPTESAPKSKPAAKRGRKSSAASDEDKGEA